MKIYSVCDKEFASFGKVIESPFLSFFEKGASNVLPPETGTSYKASVDAFESQESLDYFSNAFGCMPVQIGYCWGRNNLLNALEWHNCAEINCALEDMILLLADMRDMTDNKIDSSKVKAFKVKKGQSIEIYQTTLHFCPLSVDGKVFKSVVILPKGTNTALEKPSQNKLLIAKNKWLICHADCKKLVDAGRVVGITGENISIE